MSNNPYILFENYSSIYNLYINNKLKHEWHNYWDTLNYQLNKIYNWNFNFTPLIYSSEIEQEFNLPSNSLAIKCEYLNLTGSHKSRHAFLNMAYQEFLLKQKIISNKQELAIFSCGNAALAASAVSNALKYKLHTFIPEHINYNVEQELINNNAIIHKISRHQNNLSGDPCYAAYLKALNNGMVAFSCYANDFLINTEGIEFSAYESFTELTKQNFYPDNIIIQVGGGGLAKGFIDGMKKFYDLNIPNKKYPKIYLIQTNSCYPLYLSFINILKDFVDEYKIKFNKILSLIPIFNEILNINDLSLITTIIHNNLHHNKEFYTSVINDFLPKIFKNKDKYFKPWSYNIPQSIADGILDDTTYDGFYLICHLFETGGFPLFLNEEQLKDTYVKVQKLNYNVSATGTVGLSGLIYLQEQNIILKEEKNLIMFTGINRK